MLSLSRICTAEGSMSKTLNLTGDPEAACSSVLVDNKEKSFSKEIRGDHNIFVLSQDNSTVMMAKHYYVVQLNFSPFQTQKLGAYSP